MEGVLRLGELALVVSLSTKVTTKLESPFMTANGIWPCCQPSHRKPDIRGFYKRIRICSRLCPRWNARACAGMIWGGLGHSQLDIDVGQRKWRLSTSSSWVSVLNFATLWASNVEAHKTGLVSRVQVWYGGEHTPVSVLQDFVPEGAAAAPAHLTYIMLYTCIFPLTYSTNKKGSPRHSS